jgi:hypothetical protein
MSPTCAPPVNGAAVTRRVASGLRIEPLSIDGDTDAAWPYRCQRAEIAHRFDDNAAA